MEVDEVDFGSGSDENLPCDVEDATGDRFDLTGVVGFECAAGQCDLAE